MKLTIKQIDVLIQEQKRLQEESETLPKGFEGLVRVAEIGATARVIRLLLDLHKASDT